ncbi:MAG TPA: Ku protein [Pseudonocardiaceae bacterium]|jgi:DNA end-binding protein Ku|nr:Ku protein [Pseudonocardiaceae bacterium]
MRSIWNGSIAFGGVSIPVKAYPATEEHTSGLHQAHSSDGGRVKVRRVCEIDNAEVPYPEVVKGYELAGGDVVLLTDEDLATLPLPTTRSIEVCAFTPLEQVDPIYFGKSYYLEPEPAGTKPYVLFSEALQQSGRVAVVKVALRQRESLGVLRVRQQVIVLETMLWADEIRTPDFPFQHEDVDLSGAEINAAAGWIEKLSAPFAPEKYADSYQAALKALVQAKIDGLDVVAPTAAAQDAGTQDLLAALRTGAEATEAPPERTTRRKASVSKAKAAERKAAAAKTTANRAAGRAKKASTAGKSAH